MIKNLSVFLLSLIGISVILTYFWRDGLQMRYVLLFKPAAIYTFKLLGIHKSGIRLVLEHFTNLIPYIALCLSLPNARWRKKLIYLGYGLVVIILVHFVLIIAISKVYSVYGGSETAYIFMVPMFILNDALPLVIWFLFFYREIVSLFKKKAVTSSEHS